MGLKGAIANLIFIHAWVGPLFYLPACVVCITAALGPLALLCGLILMAALICGPAVWTFRLAVRLRLRRALRCWLPRLACTAPAYNL